MFLHEKCLLAIIVYICAKLYQFRSTMSLRNAVGAPQSCLTQKSPVHIGLSRFGWPVLTSRLPDGLFFCSYIKINQLNVLHRDSYQKWEIVPPLLVYAILPSKTEEIYTELLSIIKGLCINRMLNFEPKSIHVDFYS